jgi:hypothetical protein
MLDLNSFTIFTNNLKYSIYLFFGTVDVCYIKPKAHACAEMQAFEKQAEKLASA